MLYSFRLLILLININSETVLNWFGIKSQTNQSALSIETFKLIIESLWQRVQDGLTLTDIENTLFFLLFIRFLILVFRYNLKTSFYITCIGLCAGYLWYRHLIDIIFTYRQMLVQVPYLQRLGNSAMELDVSSQALVTTELKLGTDVHWYNPGKLIYYSFQNGILHVDSKTGLTYYIDPISMFVSNLKEESKMKVLPIYYNIYNTIIPRVFQTMGEFWNQLSGVAAYAIITRIGKRYCPYLIRWHWTFLLIIGFAEQILIYFLYRVMYFQDVVIQDKLLLSTAQGYTDPNLLLQFTILTNLLIVCVTLHVGSIFFGLFHAIWGQYFYFPFLVENTELHIGPRPKNSIYSGGQTAWQDKQVADLQRRLPKLWYGWFGGGTNSNRLFLLFTRFLNNKLSKLIQRFRK